MAKKTLKSAADAAEEQLKAGAKLLQAQLAAVEQAAGKLADKAKEHLPAATEVTARAKDLVTRRGARSGGSSPTPVMTPPDAVTPSDAVAGPDESWTVADLRAEAKRRGLTGYSRKTRAQLLAELRG